MENPEIREIQKLKSEIQKKVSQASSSGALQFRQPLLQGCQFQILLLVDSQSPSDFGLQRLVSVVAEILHPAELNSMIICLPPGMSQIPFELLDLLILLFICHSCKYVQWPWMYIHVRTHVRTYTYVGGGGECLPDMGQQIILRTACTYLASWGVASPPGVRLIVYLKG